MATVKRLCVYCGASDLVDPVYRAAAVELGTRLADAGIELVYGGGRIGLMGRLADAVLQAGGRVTGIIPAHLDNREIGHHGVNELIVVGSMHERKQLMFERSDAFAVLPGGIGTIEETLRSSPGSSSCCMTSRSSSSTSPAIGRSSWRSSTMSSRAALPRPGRAGCSRSSTPSMD